MNASTYFSFAKSTLFFSVLVLALASCSKENIEPTTSTSSSSSSASIKQNETVMPTAPDHKIVAEVGTEMKQVALNDVVSVETDPISDPGLSDRFKQVKGTDDEVSIEARPGHGTVDDSMFRQIKSTKKYSAATESKPGRETGRFRRTRLSKDMSTN